jgi:hypothetical protein
MCHPSSWDFIKVSLSTDSLHLFPSTWFYTFPHLGERVREMQWVKPELLQLVDRHADILCQGRR